MDAKQAADIIKSGNVNPSDFQELYAALAGKTEFAEAFGELRKKMLEAYAKGDSLEINQAGDSVRDDVLIVEQSDKKQKDIVRQDHNIEPWKVQARNDILQWAARAGNHDTPEVKASTEGLHAELKDGTQLNFVSENRVSVKTPAEPKAQNFDLVISLAKKNGKKVKLGENMTPEFRIALIEACAKANVQVSNLSLDDLDTYMKFLPKEKEPAVSAEEKNAVNRGHSLSGLTPEQLELLHEKGIDVDVYSHVNDQQFAEINAILHPESNKDEITTKSAVNRGHSLSGLTREQLDLLHEKGFDVDVYSHVNDQQFAEINAILHPESNKDEIITKSAVNRGHSLSGLTREQLDLLHEKGFDVDVYSHVNDQQFAEINAILHPQKNSDEQESDYAVRVRHGHSLGDLSEVDLEVLHNSGFEVDRFSHVDDSTWAQIQKVLNKDETKTADEESSKQNVQTDTGRNQAELQTNTADTASNGILEAAAAEVKKARRAAEEAEAQAKAARQAAESQAKENAQAQAKAARDAEKALEAIQKERAATEAAAKRAQAEREAAEAARRSTTAKGQKTEDAGQEASGVARKPDNGISAVLSAVAEHAAAREAATAAAGKKQDKNAVSDTPVANDTGKVKKEAKVEKTDKTPDKTVTPASADGKEKVEKSDKTSGKTVTPVSADGKEKVEKSEEAGRGTAAEAKGNGTESAVEKTSKDKTDTANGKGKNGQEPAQNTPSQDPKKVEKPKKKEGWLARTWSKWKNKVKTGAIIVGTVVASFFVGRSCSGNSGENTNRDDDISHRIENVVTATPTDSLVREITPIDSVSNETDWVDAPTQWAPGMWGTADQFNNMYKLTLKHSPDGAMWDRMYNNANNNAAQLGMQDGLELIYKTMRLAAWTNALNGKTCSEHGASWASTYSGAYGDIVGPLMGVIKCGDQLDAATAAKAKTLLSAVSDGGRLNVFTLDKVVPGSSRYNDHDADGWIIGKNRNVMVDINDECGTNSQVGFRLGGTVQQRRVVKPTPVVIEEPGDTVRRKRPDVVIEEPGDTVRRKLPDVVIEVPGDTVRVKAKPVVIQEEPDTTPSVVQPKGHVAVGSRSNLSDRPGAEGVSHAAAVRDRGSDKGLTGAQKRQIIGMAGEALKAGRITQAEYDSIVAETKGSGKGSGKGKVQIPVNERE